MPNITVPEPKVKKKKSGATEPLKKRIVNARTQAKVPGIQKEIWRSLHGFHRYHTKAFDMLIAPLGIGVYEQAILRYLLGLLDAPGMKWDSWIDFPLTALAQAINSDRKTVHRKSVILHDKGLLYMEEKHRIGAVSTEWCLAPLFDTMVEMTGLTRSQLLAAYDDTEESLVSIENHEN